METSLSAVELTGTINEAKQILYQLTLRRFVFSRFQAAFRARGT